MSRNLISTLALSLSLFAALPSSYAADEVKTQEFDASPLAVAAVSTTVSAATSTETAATGAPLSDPAEVTAALIAALAAPSTSTQIDSGAVAAAAPVQPLTLTIATFNSLAPCWIDATGTGYPVNPATGDKSYLATSYRLPRIINEVNALFAAGADVVCMQEMTDDVFSAVSSAIGSGYAGFMAHHAPQFWLDYQNDKANPVPNGNATFVNKQNWTVTTFIDKQTHTDGNHGCFTRVQPKRGSSHTFNIMNVHLDSDHGGNRKQELEGVVTFLTPYGSTNDTLVVAGDYNCDAGHASVQQTLTSNGFVNTKNPDEATHPFTLGYNNNQLYASIDHILLRNNNGASAVGDTTVRSHGLWSTYPFQNPNDPSEAARIVANFGICGSDHFSVIGSVQHQ